MNDIALMDMDDSIAAYSDQMVEDLNKLRSPNEPELTKEMLWDGEKLEYISRRMDLIKHMPGWWGNLLPIAKGFAVLDAFREYGFKIHILTKGPKKHSSAWTEKVKWCQKYIGYDVDINITSDKSLVYGKILYDDYPEYMLKWLEHRPRGLGIMPVTLGNKNFKHPNVVMYDNNLEEVKEAIKKVKIRESKEELFLTST